MGNPQGQAPNGEDGALNPRSGNKDFFFYSTAVAAISTVVPTVNSTIQIDADADFFWIASTYQASIAGAVLTEATNVIPLVNLLITDGGSGKAFSNNAIPLGTYAGDGKRPYRLIRPRVIGASATLTFAWSNFVAAGTSYAITFVMHGYKRYLGMR